MRVLFLTHRLPYAPNRGDRIRAFHLLPHLAGVASVDLVSLVHDDAEEAHAGDLKGVVSSVATARVSRLRAVPGVAAALATRIPLTHALLDSPSIARTIARVVADRPPDVVLAYCSGMARFALEPPLRGIPLVLDLVDVDSMKWADLSRKEHAPLRWIYHREAACLRRFEANAVRTARTTLVVNSREREAVTAIVPDARVRVVGNGIDTAAFAPPEQPWSAPTVTFCGVMNYRPNEEGALWLAREIWPLVRDKYVGAELVLVGSSPTAAVTELAVRDPTVVVTGTVDDVRPYLWRSAVGVAPLLVARGLQNKVIEAIAAGLPCVVTPAVYAGLPEDIKPGCAVGNDVAGFAAAIDHLLAMPAAARRALAAKADLRSLTWSEQLEPLGSILKEAAMS